MKKNKLEKKSVRAKIVKYSLVLLVTAMLGSSLISYYFTSKLLLESSASLNNSLLGGINKNISEIFQSTDVTYKLISNNNELMFNLQEMSRPGASNDESPTLLKSRNEYIRLALTELSSYNKSMINDVVITVNNEYFSSNTGRLLDFTNKNEFTQYIDSQGDEDVTFVHLSGDIPGIKANSIYFREPYAVVRKIYDSNRKFFAKIIFFLNNDKMSALMGNFNLAIMDSKNKIIFSRDDKDSALNTFLGNAFINDYFNKKVNNFIQKIDGKNYFISYMSLDHYNWKVINLLSTDIFYRGIAQIRLYSIYIFASTSILMFLLIYLFSFNISKNLKNIIKAFNSVATNKIETISKSKKKKVTGRFFSQFSFSKKLLLYFIVIILLPTILINIMSYTRMSSLIRTQMLDIVSDTHEAKTENLKNLIDGYNRISRYIVGNDRLQSFIFNYKEDSFDDVQNVKIKEEISKELDKVIFDYNYFLQILLYDKNGKMIYTSSNIINDNMDITNTIQYNMTTRSQWYLFYDQKINKYFIGINKKSYGLKEHYNGWMGSCNIKFDVKVISDVYSQEGDSTEAFIVDEENKVIASTDTSFINDKLELSQAKVYGDKYKYIINAGKKMYLFKSILDEPKWTIYQTYSNDMAEKNNASLAYALVIFLLILVLFIIIISNRLSKFLIEPVNNLNIAFGSLEQLNLNIRYDRIKGDELDYLSEGFNKMVERLDNLIQEVYKSKITEKELELKTLQSQINPHFLYNTLETINAMVDLGDSRACDMIYLLSRFFRLGVNKGQALTTIKDEIEYTKVYIQIQQIRYGDKLTVQWNYKEYIENYKTANLILQPIIENSLKHGIELSPNPGIIRIKIYKVNNKIKMTITDNGVGMTKDELIVLRKTLAGEVKAKSIGINNVHARIQLYFGEEYGIKVYSRKLKGSIVVVCIPVKSEGNA